MVGIIEVSLGFLRKLAGIHDTLVPEVNRATTVTASVPQAVEISHGTASQASNTALADLQKVRSAVGEGMAGVESDLASKLRLSAQNYSNTDSGSAGILGRIFGK